MGTQQNMVQLIRIRGNQTAESRMSSSVICWIAIATSILTCTTSAFALDTRDKLPPAKMAAVLAEEHQDSLCRAKFIINPGDKEKMKTLYLDITANKKGDGYLLVYDHPNHDESKIVYVFGKFRSGQFIDPASTSWTRPKDVLPESDLARYIERGRTAGDIPVIHGETLKKLPDGKEERAGTITIMYGAPKDDPKDLASMAGTLIILEGYPDGSAVMNKVVGAAIYPMCRKQD